MADKWDKYAVDEWDKYVISQEQTPSIKTQGVSYIKEHPFKTAFESPVKTFTGETIGQKFDKSVSGASPFVRSFDLYGNNPLAKAQAFGESFMTGMAGDVAELASSPASLATAGLSSLKGVQKIGNAISGTKPMQAVGRFLTKERMPIVNDKNLDSFIKQSINQGIKPSTVGKKFGSQIDQYGTNAVNAVKDIVANKDKLGLLDEFGNPAQRVPQNLKETIDGIDNLKSNIWNEIESSAQQTGQSGVMIDGRKMANVILREFRKSKYKLNPQLVNSAIQEANNFKNVGQIKPTDGLSHMKTLNQRLTGYFRNGIYETGKNSDVDAFIAKTLNNMMDDAINSATGKQYKALRQRYGNLKTIEGDLVKRYAVDVRKNAKGFFDLGDIWSDGQIVRGIMRIDPADIASGIVQKVLVKTFKNFNNPDRIIRKMFQTVEKKYVPNIK